MKVIDLLNKIANKEPLPNKIKIECVNSINEHNCYYHFNPIAETYVNDDNTLIQNATCFATLLDLEVEIIEEDKKIQYVGKEYDLTKFRNDYPEVAYCLRDLCNKTKEIIDMLNKE